MSEEKKMMSVDEMEDAAGGKNHGYGFGFYMTQRYLPCTQKCYSL